MPEIFRDLLSCVVCDKGGVGVKKCSKCFSVSYCGKDCQVADWARHKRLCDPVMVKDYGEKGRGLVASKNFKAGDIIFKDTSIVSVIIPDKITTIDQIKFGKDVYDQISILELGWLLQKFPFLMLWCSISKNKRLLSHFNSN